MSQNKGLPENYTYYIDNTLPELQVNKKKYKSIIKKFSLKVIKEVLDGEEVKLPIIGTLRVKKIKHSFKKNKLKIDYHTSKKLGKKVYFLNEHRDGYFYRIMWKRNKIKNSRIYSFVPERHNFKRPLVNILKNQMSKDYFEN